MRRTIVWGNRNGEKGKDEGNGFLIDWCCNTTNFWRSQASRGVDLLEHPAQENTRRGREGIPNVMENEFYHYVIFFIHLNNFDTLEVT